MNYIKVIPQSGSECQNMCAGAKIFFEVNVFRFDSTDELTEMTSVVKKMSPGKGPITLCFGIDIKYALMLTQYIAPDSMLDVSEYDPSKFFG